MLDFRANEIVIVDGLKEYLSKFGRPCEVVRANQTGPIPPYPYVAYTVTTPMHEYGGTYGIDQNGTMFRSALQTWSFTAQSDDQEEAISTAYRIYDYFTAAGVTLLADKGITVRRARDITSRDNLLTMQYEYRNGLDVTFGLMYTITKGEQNDPDVIETNTFKEV